MRRTAVQRGACEQAPLCSPSNRPWGPTHFCTVESSQSDTYTTPLNTATPMGWNRGCASVVPMLDCHVPARLNTCGAGQGCL